MNRKANNLFSSTKKIWVSRFLLLGFFGQFIVADSLQADPLLSSNASDSQKVMPALVNYSEDQNEAVVADQSELQTLQQNNPTQNSSNLSTLPVSVSNAQAAGILIQAGYFTQAQYDEFIAGLSFDETYSQMSSDDFMKLLVGKKIVLDSIQSADDLKAALKAKGVDAEMAQLRPDGILQALGNPVGGSLLKFPEIDLNAVIKSKAALESQFQTVEAKKAFLEYFSTENFLELLGGKNETQAPVEFDPFFGLSKHIGNLDLINIDPDFLVKSFNPSDFMRTFTKEQDILAALSNPVNIQSAIKRLAAMPEGARLVYIGGPILYDFYDSAGRPISDFDPLTIIKDGVTYTFEGYSMSNWVNTVQKRMDTFMAALKAGLDEYNRVNGTNVKVDYLMIDYEEKTASNYELNGQNYEPDPARPGYNRRKAGPSVWEAIMQDPNWAKIESETGLTKEDIVAGLDKNGNLTGSSSMPRVTAQIWNIYQERQRALNFYHAIMEPTHKYFENAVGGSFEDGFRSDIGAGGHNFFRFTNMWGGLGGLDAAGIQGLLPSEGLRLADYDNTPSGNSDFATTNFDQLLALVSVARTNIQVSDIKSLHWMSGPDYYNPALGNTDVLGSTTPLPYFAELAFHAAMNGADQLFFQTSSWSTQTGHAYTEAIMQELNDSNLFAYTDRKPITYDSIHSGQDFLVSGVQSNGKNIYRVSWESGPLSGVLINDGTNGQPVVFKKGDSVVTIPGGRIYIPAGGEIKTLSFDSATNSVTTTGAWVIVDDISAGKILNQNVSTLLNEVSKPPLPSGIQSFADDLRLSLPSGYTVSDPVETKAAGIYTVTISAPASIANGDLQSANFLIMTDSNDKTVVLPKSVKLTFKNISNSPNGEIVFTGMADLGNAIASGVAAAENPLTMISKMNVQEVSSDGLNIKFTYNGDSYFRTGMVYNDPQNGSMMRSGWIHFPNDDASLQNLPLVLSFHGGYGTGAQQMVQSLMNDSSDQAGYAVVYLDGFMTCWNAVIPTASSSKNVDDVGFVDSFLDSFISKYHVDTNKIYLTGISNGGQMVYRLASESKYTFAGVALVSSGILNTDDYEPKADTPILIIHGTADTHIPYAGGVGSSAMNPQNYLSVNSLLQYVQQLNGISASDLGANYLPYPDFSSLKVSSKVWGSDKNEVVMITVSGGVHTWFGANFKSEKPGSYAYHAISANQAIWNFFNHHALNSIPTVDPEVKSLVDALAVEMPGYVSEITFAPKGSSKPYIVTFNYAQSAAPTGQLQSLSFFVDKSGNIELNEVHYSGIATDTLDPKVFFTGLSNISYGKENPIILMSKLQMESVTLASGIYYANFKLNSESWRIYVENSVVKINKRLSDAVRSYRDSLRKDLGPNYSVDVFPDPNTPFLFSLTVSYKGTAAIADGQLESMSAKILNQNSMTLSNLVINFHNLKQAVDSNLLIQGLGQLVGTSSFTSSSTSSSSVQVIPLIRVSSVDSDGTIHFILNNDKWKVSKDPNGAAKLEKDIKIVPTNVQNFSNSLMASMPGFISTALIAAPGSPLPYVIFVTNPKQEKGKLAYLGIYIDDALNIQFVGANYWGVPANKPEPKLFFEGLSNMPYGQENPILLMMKLKIESITLGTDGTEYTNFILNGEYWRIYQKSGVTRITKRRSPEVIDYENQLQKNLGQNFIVDIAPDSTNPFTYKAVIYPAVASSVKGSFKAMEYTIKSSDGKMSFDFKNLKVHFNGITPDPDPNLLNLGLMQLNSSDPLILMTQIRITSVDTVNNIIYFNFSNLSWKIYKDATGRVRLEVIPLKK